MSAKAPTRVTAPWGSRPLALGSHWQYQPSPQSRASFRQQALGWGACTDRRALRGPHCFWSASPGLRGLSWGRGGLERPAPGLFS